MIPIDRRALMTGALAVSGMAANAAFAQDLSIRPAGSAATGPDAALDMAAALGTRVGLVRGLSLMVVTLLCATATTVAGPIGFVGLMAPLTASWLMGPHRGWIVALCALGGPVVVLAADVLGRVLARPGEMQVGLLTAFVGSPVLLLMVLRMKDRAS